MSVGQKNPTAMAFGGDTSTKQGHAIKRKQDGLHVLVEMWKRQLD